MNYFSSALCRPHLVSFACRAHCATCEMLKDKPENTKAQHPLRPYKLIARLDWLISLLPGNYSLVCYFSVWHSFVPASHMSQIYCSSWFYITLNWISLGFWALGRPKQRQLKTTEHFVDLGIHTLKPLGSVWIFLLVLVLDQTIIIKIHRGQWCSLPLLLPVNHWEPETLEDKNVLVFKLWKVTYVLLVTCQGTADANWLQANSCTMHQMGINV